MKVVAYSIKPFEKEFLARANQKKHDITLISNPLDLETAAFAEVKDAVVIFTNDDASAAVINKLADLGVKYISTRSTGTDHIDQAVAQKRGIKIANVPVYSPQAIAEHTIALVLALDRKLIVATDHGRNFNFRNDELIGFNLHGKTVGIIGMGHIGLATAAIFKGFGCKVIGFDINPKTEHDHVPLIDLKQLLAESDIISLHAPLTNETKGMINRGTISQMKDGVMIINTARGGLIKTTDIINALESGKVGYLGLDVYEFEKGLFFEDHVEDEQKDLMLKKLIDNPNVLVTPHQAYLTKEALQEIANQTIINLDGWRKEQIAAEEFTGDKDYLKKLTVAVKLPQQNPHLLP